MSLRDVAADPWPLQHKGQMTALGIQCTSPMKHPIEQQTPAQIWPKSSASTSDQSRRVPTSHSQCSLAICTYMHLIFNYT